MTSEPYLNPFACPNQVDPELKSFFDRASSLLCEWFSNTHNQGPLPSSSFLPDVSPLEKGLSSDELLDDLKKIMDGAYQPSHPGALAHLDPPPLTASIVGDFISAGLNNNLLALELSPSLSSLERRLCLWFSEVLGFSPLAGGVAASGGSLSNLMALVVARHHAGLDNDSSAVVLASSESHVCLTKAVRVMGLPDDALQKVDVEESGQISIESLQDNFQRLKRAGRKCFVVVGTAGTTVCGAIDPLEKIYEFCSTEKIWFHVDAAIGGVFALSDSTSELVNGIAFANSVTLNPQKVLGITKTSSLLIVANRDHLLSTFCTGLPYIEPPLGDELHGGEIGIQGTRSAEVLKLWIGLRQLGKSGIENLLNDSIARRKYLQQRIDLAKFNVFSGPLHLIAFAPSGLSKDQSASWSAITKTNLLEKGFMLSRPFYRESYLLKAVLGNPHTRTKHLDLLAEYLNNFSSI